MMTPMMTWQEKEVHKNSVRNMDGNALPDVTSVIYYWNIYSYALNWSVTAKK